MRYQTFSAVKYLLENAVGSFKKFNLFGKKKYKHMYIDFSLDSLNFRLNFVF